ncbi:ABC transporter ATP-binding protein [Candidatus Margulisiibacteriota bacterium]
MALIKTVDLSKIYISGKKIETKALKYINVEIEEGEFTVIHGPSGSGKTTLLNMVGGLDAPTSGDVYFDNDLISKKKEAPLSKIRLHKIGFIFQAYNLIPVLTAMENIEYVMMLQGIEEKVRRDKAQKIADHIGIGELLHKTPSEMSGGQQQRVAIARAIVGEPKLILADEPTANIDSETGSGLLDMMKKLNEEKNITFVFSTHDPMVIEKARRKISLHDGKIINS